MHHRDTDPLHERGEKQEGPTVGSEVWKLISATVGKRVVKKAEAKNLKLKSVKCDNLIFSRVALIIFCM